MTRRLVVSEPSCNPSLLYNVNSKSYLGRLSDCCARLNLIGQAAFRVVFDERHKHEDYDPLHNAGCIHLFCLEKYFDFPDICAKLNVSAEDRSLPKVSKFPRPPVSQELALILGI